MSTFEQIKDYATSFDPQFESRIRGASEEEIEELQDRLDGPIPDVYLDFLRVMGKDTDWVTIDRLSFSIDAVLEYYREHRWPSAFNYIRIGTDSRDPAFHPYIEVNPLPDTEQEVIAIPDCSEGTFDEVSVRFRAPMAGSLPELFAMPVFEMHELYGPDRKPAELVAADWGNGAIDRADAILKAGGFEKVWFSSSTGRAFRRKDAAVRLKQFGGHPLQAIVRAEQAEDQAAIVRKLAPALAA